MKQETEIKLPLSGTAAEARGRIESAGGRLERGRVFEDNCLYDDAAYSLARAGKILRMRRLSEAPSEPGRNRVAGAASREGLLTWKELAAGTDSAAGSRYKIRTEIETRVDDAEALDTVLQRLGFRIVYRYQKYRTTFRSGSLEVCLDETPIGLFAELEGDGPAIDAFARVLGFGPADYVTLSYRGLQEQRLAGTGAEPGDMVFRDE